MGFQGDFGRIILAFDFALDDFELVVERVLPAVGVGAFHLCDFCRVDGPF